MGELFAARLSWLVAGHAFALDQPERDVLPDPHAVEQRGALEEHAELVHESVAVAYARRRFFAVDTNAAAFRGQQTETHFSVTDLPVPDPPMMTTDSPRPTSRSTPLRTCLGPKALVDAAQADFGLVVIASSRRKAG